MPTDVLPTIASKCVQMPRLVGELICFKEFREWFFQAQFNEVAPVLQSRGYVLEPAHLDFIAAFKSAGFTRNVEDPLDGYLYSKPVANPIQCTLAATEYLIELSIRETNNTQRCRWPCG